MLPSVTLPVGLVEVLGVCREAFTAPTFKVFVVLVTGFLRATGPRTVTGMWTAAGLAGIAHHCRAHRFFATARWEADTVGLALARAAVAPLIPPGGPVQVAVDDTLFHRYGRKVFGAAWQHDGSARGRDGIGRGNCFVVLGPVVSIPGMTRQVFAPVLFRLYRPKRTGSKPELARELVGVVDGRMIHVSADAGYRGPAWRRLPANVTFTSRPPSNAVLHAPAPPRTGKRGRPRLKGDRLGTPADLAAGATWHATTVTRY